MRGEVGNLTEIKLNNDSGNLKGKSVETRTKLISGGGKLSTHLTDKTFGKRVL